MAIIGFDSGGPVTLCTIGRGRESFVTYVTCELSVREQQIPADCGRYEATMTCDDQKWAHQILTQLGRMSFDSEFGHGHTLDLSPLVGETFPIQGLVVEEFARVEIEGATYGILYFHGVTRPELEFAMQAGVDALIKCLKKAGVYPNTSVHRTDSVETSKR